MAADVLIIEDDIDLAEIMESTLQAAGYDVRAAEDGRAALAMIEERMPALILLDMCMPKMDGWEFAHAFRNRHADAVPIIVVTAGEHARRRHAEIGARDVLPKPFNLEALRRIVNKHTSARPNAG
jgi:DNA-binding response OmpR family regulator